MRSFGAGILPRVVTADLGAEPMFVLQVRGSNRGSVWPLGIPIPDVLCWKELAGVTGAPDELLDPRTTAIQELYEEIGFASNTSLLLPSDLDHYPETQEQVSVAVDRINRHYRFDLSPAYGYYAPVTPDSIEGHARACS